MNAPNIKIVKNTLAPLKRQFAKAYPLMEATIIEAMTEGLSRLGVEISSTEDGWIINGDPQRSFDGSYTVESHGDHRIAMCFMIARLKQSEGLLSIVDADCLEVSYPEFPEKYIQYRARLEEISKVSKNESMIED